MSDHNLPARYADGRFGPGNPGRPLGSYNRASRRAALAILNHFEAIQHNFLDKLEYNSAMYIALLSKVLPRQIEIGASGLAGISDLEVIKAFAAARQRMNGQGDGPTVLAELEAALLTESGLGDR